MAYTNIDFPAEYFNTVLYSGNSTTNAITGVGFQPDWIWAKVRSTTYDHRSFDAVRGASAKLFQNRTYAEVTSTTNDNLVSFDSNGFTFGATGSTSGTNESGQTFVAWNWKANGAGVSNTDGTITSTVSANTTSGFSIVSYTGTGANATVGHGLGVAPDFLIIKNRTGTNSWPVWSRSYGNAGVLFLDLVNGPPDTNSVFLNGTTPTSSVFSIGTAGHVNTSASNYIAYVFNSVKGYSKFGSYTGNGSTDGTFIYTGFKPAWVMIKQTSASGEGWEMADNKRSTYNVISTFLRGNSDAAESTNTDRQFDFLSNGIKMRGSHGSTNGSGATYIYMAFAENPFVSSTGIPTTAR